MRTSTKPRIAFVQSCWHRDIVDRGRDGFLAETGENTNVEIVEVPGAFELPLLVMDLARTGGFDAIAACGFVVDGGIYRHEFVAHAVIDGLMRAQLDTGVPVFSGVLTPQSFHESQTHIEFFADHMEMKGRELAQACLATMSARESVLAAAS